MKYINDTVICIFACNRVTSLKNLLKDIKKNNNYQKYSYYFFVDTPKEDISLNIQNLISQVIKNFKKKLKAKIIYREKNLGLSKNIIKGINYVKKKYRKIIVLEDDLRVSRNYINFMQKNLDQFENDKHIYSITGYVFPKKIFSLGEKNKSIFLCKRPNSWGWATWSTKWNKVNFNNKKFRNIYRKRSKAKILGDYGNDLEFILRDTLNGKINSWAIKWTIYHILNSKYCIFPLKTLVNEEGYKYMPTNNRFKLDKFNHKKIYSYKLPKITKILTENEDIRMQFKKIYNFTLYKRIYKKFIN
tara:strand:+ start:1958 stop:2863 length:906 start_codon:yes stop_codon:yes gene_type:complete